jgi:hypothetical protein
MEGSVLAKVLERASRPSGLDEVEFTPDLRGAEDPR